MRGSLDAALPPRPEESPAPPISRAVPWTPAAAASLFRGWDLAWGHPPPPRGGFRTVACVEAAAVTSQAGMVGASWDLEAEGYRRGEGTDLVAPAEL